MKWWLWLLKATAFRSFLHLLAAPTLCCFNVLYLVKVQVQLACSPSLFTSLSPSPDLQTGSFSEWTRVCWRSCCGSRWTPGWLARLRIAPAPLQESGNLACGSLSTLPTGDRSGERWYWVGRPSPSAPPSSVGASHPRLSSLLPMPGEVKSVQKWWFSWLQTQRKRRIEDDDDCTSILAGISSSMAPPIDIVREGRAPRSLNVPTRYRPLLGRLRRVSVLV